MVYTSPDGVAVDSPSKPDDLIREKLVAALERGYFRTFDLFAGCGGLSLGFDRAGFRSIGAVELDPDARCSHEANFAEPTLDEQYATYGDITKTSPLDAVKHLASIPADHSVDVIIGGPPCQAFSRLGRAALWDLAGRRQAHQDDPRATLYEYFLEYIAVLKPIAFVMENVREMGKFGRTNVAHEIALTTEALGYTTRYTILNAVWYGVPQLRERLIMIGIHNALDAEPRFPMITHDYQVPVGYSTSRFGDRQD